MRADWLDWLAVGLAVAFAAVWLGFHVRRLRRGKDRAGAGIGACGAPCAGCRFRRNCGGQNG